MDQAEKLRAIVKQQNQINTSNTRIITVTSGKGGVGKSSVSINIALQFRREGKKVIIFDADFGLANIEVMFGVIPQYTLADLMFRGKELKEIITEGPEGVMFVSGGSGVAKLVNLDHEQIKRLVHKLSELEDMADVIIVDTGAGISTSVLEFVAASPEVILVTTPEPTSITDSYALLKALAMHQDFDRDTTRINVVANKVSTSAESNSIFDKLSAVVERFLGIELTYLGYVPYDSNITRAVMKQTPVSIAYPTSAPAKAMRSISDRLMSKEGEDEASEGRRGVSYFFDRVFANRRKRK